MPFLMLVKKLFRCSSTVSRRLIVNMSSETEKNEVSGGTEVLSLKIDSSNESLNGLTPVNTGELQPQNPTSVAAEADSSTDIPTEGTPMNQFETKLFNSAAAGNIEEVTSLLKIKGGKKSLNWKNDRGWTSLMLAARNGHTEVVKALLAEGSDVNILNASGQTALDVANFWNHQDIVNILTGKGRVKEDKPHFNFFSQNPLYRASEKRNDLAWLQKVQKSPTTNFVIFSELKPFVVPVKKTDSDNNKKSGYKLALFQYKNLADCLAKSPLVIFLGMETWDPKSTSWFAVDVTGVDAKVFQDIYSDGFFDDSFPTTMQLTETNAGIFAEARSILCWHDRYQFCPTCGSSTTIADAGYRRKCDNSECRSHKGIHNTNHPRVDPSLIMLVVSPEGKRCLLGRKKGFPPKMYSCLAGYMEPGESIEAACCREVEEESGVNVGRIVYHSSQPWPFPAVIMLGCIAYAKTDSLRIETDELEDARWFTRQDVTAMANRTHPLGFFLPPAQAIAHQLVKSWLHPPANL